MELLLEHLGKGLMASLLISMPVVLVAAFIGLIVGVLQAVTQIQEQTIAAAPKILGVFLAIMIMSSFFMKILTEYLEDSINLAFNVIPKQGEFLLPPESMTANQNKKFFEEIKNYTGKGRPGVEEVMKNPGKIPYGDKKEKLSVSGASRSPSSHPNFVEARKLYSR